MTKQYKTGYVTDPQRVELRFTSEWEAKADRKMLHAKRTEACLALLKELNKRHVMERGNFNARQAREQKKVADMIQEERESPTP